MTETARSPSGGLPGYLRPSLAILMALGATVGTPREFNVLLLLLSLAVAYIIRPSEGPKEKALSVVCKLATGVIYVSLTVVITHVIIVSSISRN